MQRVRSRHRLHQNHSRKEHAGGSDADQLRTGRRAEHIRDDGRHREARERAEVERRPGGNDDRVPEPLRNLSRSGSFFREEEAMTQRRRRRRPAPLPKPATYYDKTESKYPDRVRVSFMDGHTEVYDRRVNQPQQQLIYINAPYPRRRRR